MVAFSAITTVPFTAAFYESIIACSSPAVVSHPQPPAYNVIVVPGNPGQPGFYTSFVNELLPMLTPSSTWRVSVVGLRGHVTGATRRKASLYEFMRGSFMHHGLDAQLDHVAACVAQDAARTSAPRGERTIVVGHSIGAYLACEAMRRHPNDVHACVGIMPFLEASEMVPEYRRLRFLLRWFWPVLYVLATVAELAGRVLPLSLRRAMMSGHTNAMDPAVADYTVKGMLSFGAVANYLHLGKTEFVNHATPFDFQAKLTPAAGDRTAAAAVGAAADASLGTAAKAKTPSKEEIAAAVGAGSSGPLAAKMHLMYTDGDMWAPLSGEERARAAGVPTTVVRGLPHAFGIKKESATKVAAWTAQHLAKLVEADQANAQK